MKKKYLLKVISSSILFVGIVGALFYFIVLPKLNWNKPIESLANAGFGWRYPVAKFPSVGPEGQNLIAYSNIRDPGGVPKGLPVRLKIPSIGVNTAIEDAYITADGRMDVPAGSTNVAWFSLGPHPGQVGSAVVGGHYGITDGVPFVFYRLDQLKVGNKVYIEDDNGDTLAFIVRRIELFGRDADSTTVFTSEDGLAHLNLITCEGIWNQVNDTYPDRRVVFTDRIADEGAVEVSAIPTPKLPSTAVTSPTPTSTEPSVTETELVTSTLPTDDATSTPASPTFIQNSISYIKSLFNNPVDSIITLLLITSIIVIVIKINRK